MGGMRMDKRDLLTYLLIGVLICSSGMTLLPAPTFASPDNVYEVRYDPVNTGHFDTTPALNVTKVWNLTVEGFIGSYPAVVDGLLYFGTVYDNTTYCLNATTGAHVWSYDMPHYIASSPAVADGKVYFGCGNNLTYCFDALTGTMIWNYTHASMVGSSPKIDSGRLYIGSIMDGRIYCLNASTGASIWNYSTGSYIYSTAAIAGGWVYMGSFDQNMYCLNATDGTPNWSFPAGGEIFGCAALVSGRLYFSTFSNQKVFCINASTGAHIWNYTTGAPNQGSPAVANNRVYAPSGDNKLYCLDALTGVSLWNYTTGYLVVSCPTVVQNFVYVGSMDKEMYCLDATTGSKIWNYTAEEAIVYGPVVVDGYIYFATQPPATPPGPGVFTNLYCLYGLSLTWDQTPSDRWFELLEEPVRYDLNASSAWNIDSWTINDTSHFAISATGVITNTSLLLTGDYPVTVTVEDTTTTELTTKFVIKVQDTHAPYWLEPWNHINITYGTPLHYDLNASDPSGIDTWWVNDTTHFAIDSSGVLSNATVLELGTYFVDVSVNDTFGNFLISSIRIIVKAATGGVPIDMTFLLLVGGGGAAVVIVILVIYFYTKKK